LRKHTQLSLQHIRHGLAVLIQQDLVYHHFDVDSNTTYYEANHNAAYKLVWSGKICEIVESRFGHAAKDIVVNLFQLGHTRVSELVAAYKKLEHKAVNNGDVEDEEFVNGNHATELAISTLQLHATLVQLLEAGLLEPVDARMFRSPTDTYQMFEREVLRDFRDGVKGAKGKEEVVNKVRERMHDLREEVSTWIAKSGLKRTLNGDNHINGAMKRRKLANGYANGDHDYGAVDGGPTLDVGVELAPFN
jgi:DNA-directed RNA polymerase III subunit RPC3